MQQEKAEQFIPTIRQLHRQLKQSYNQLNQTFIDIGVSPLPASEDLEGKKITINKVLKEIPEEKRLEHILSTAPKGRIKDRLTKYSGNYELIKQAKNKFQDIKKQQQRIYFLAAQCDLPSVSCQFKEKKPQNLAELASYKNVAQKKKTKNKTLQKNCISDMYLQEGQAELDSKNQPIIISSKRNQQLKKLDLLIHVNFYDSHNSQKQYEFICVQEQILSSLVQKFKCLIDTLGNIQKLRKKPENDSQNSQIYDKFYQPPVAEKSANKSHNLRNQIGNTTSNLKYLLIQDSIYYDGNKNELDKLITAGLNRNNRCVFHNYEFGKTKISDLRVIFGKPYIYRHLQGCDHIVIFKQARLFMGNDQFNHDIVQVDKYPITVYESKMKRKKCEGCSEMFSEIVSIGDPLKNGENLYLCMGCHQDLHLDEHGNPKQGEKIKFVNYIHD